jgi:inosine-uridine nucleoside N-ribohydrolase
LSPTRCSQDWRKNILGKSGSAQSQLMAKVERVILEGELYGAWHRCDPMAAALAIKPDIVTASERRYATVELRGQETRGALVVDHLDKLGRSHNVTIVQRLDLERYKVMLLKAFSLDMKGNSSASSK